MKTVRLALPLALGVLLAASLACAVQVPPSLIATVFPPLTQPADTQQPRPTSRANPPATDVPAAQDTPSGPPTAAPPPLPTLTAPPTSANRATNPQEQALVDLKKTAPTFLSHARGLIEQQRFAEALESVNASLALAPNVPDAHLTKGCVLQDLFRFSEAAESY